MNSIAREKFFSGSAPQPIWMSATLVASAIGQFTTEATEITEEHAPFNLFDLRDLCGENHFTESAGTILTLSTTTRLVGLLGSPMLFLVTGVSPIFSRTSSPLISLPNVVY